MTKAKIVLLPGDGIGPEVCQAAHDTLKTVADLYGHEFEFSERPIGGNAIDAFGDPLPAETLNACRQADAVLLGAVGGPKWSNPAAPVRPEQGLLGLRKELGLFANLRPIKPTPWLMAASPLKAEYLQGTDMLVLRELTGGIYFGKPSQRYTQGEDEWAVDTMSYHRYEIDRAARMAFELAGRRRGKVTSVDKANVLESSRLWRETVVAAAKDYPDIILEELLIDAAAMHVLTRPSDFDVILTANLFGDILTDEVSVLTGSLGNLPSASIGSEVNNLGLPRGVYEPIHGSAPDIAGQGIANPIGMILSGALLLRHSLGLDREAQAVEAAVDAALEAGCRTADLTAERASALSTGNMKKFIITQLEKSAVDANNNKSLGEER